MSEFLKQRKVQLAKDLQGLSHASEMLGDVVMKLEVIVECADQKELVELENGELDKEVEKGLEVLDAFIITFNKSEHPEFITPDIAHLATDLIDKYIKGKDQPSLREELEDVFNPLFEKLQKMDIEGFDKDQVKECLDSFEELWQQNDEVTGTLPVCLLFANDIYKERILENQQQTISHTERYLVEDGSDPLAIKNSPEAAYKMIQDFRSECESNIDLTAVSPDELQAAMIFDSFTIRHAEIRVNTECPKDWRKDSDAALESFMMGRDTAESVEKGLYTALDPLLTLMATSHSKQTSQFRDAWKKGIDGSEPLYKLYNQQIIKDREAQRGR